MLPYHQISNLYQKKGLKFSSFHLFSERKMSFITFLKIVILAPPRILKNLVPTESEPKIRNMYQIRFFIFALYGRNPAQNNPGFTKHQLLKILKSLENWAIGSDAVPVLPTVLRGWRTNWAVFLALGHPEPGSAASESKKSVKFEPSLSSLTQT